MNAGLSRHSDRQRLANFAPANNGDRLPDERIKWPKIGDEIT
jgi:hypothetical protein